MRPHSMTKTSMTRSAIAFVLAVRAAFGTALCTPRDAAASNGRRAAPMRSAADAVRTDPRISVADDAEAGGVRAVQVPVEDEAGARSERAGGADAADPARSLIGFRGFKSIAFVGTASETVHAVDVDFGTPLWKYHINYSASPPPVAWHWRRVPGRVDGGAVPADADRAAGARRRWWRRWRRGGRSGGGVGEPGKGSLTLATAGQGRGGGRRARPAGRRGAGRRGAGHGARIGGGGRR